MRAPILALVLLSAACRTSNLGSCSDDSQCPTGTACDPAARVCAVPQGACFPLCDTGHTCDAASATCVAVLAPDVTVTSPAAQASVSSTALPVSATAHAPGGVTGVRFELRSPSGSLLASATATHGAEPAAWAATFDLSATAPGPADVTAFASWAHGTATSGAVRITLVDNEAPQIAGVTYTPAPVNGFFGHGSAIAVHATITDRSGVDASTVCLRITGETAACPHPGTAGANNAWTFSLPRPAAEGPLTYSIEASDTGGRKAHSDQTVAFDYSGPAIAIAADAAPHARDATPIVVNAVITDPAGVPDGGVLLNGTQQPSARDGGLFTFQLDARAAPAGSEGPLPFQISASDGVGNASQAGGSRIVDDAPPQVTVQIYKDAPDGGGVTYPAAVANTGWTGATFVYTDTVHVQGTLTDLSGVTGATLHVDGIALDGGVSRGPSHAITCPSAVTCPFSFDVKLSDTAFHSGTSTFDAGVNLGFVPAAPLQFTVDAQDPLAHAVSSATPALTTRFLWTETLPGAAVSGLAIAPGGDVIATLDAGNGDTVFALAADQPAIHWSYGADAGTPVGAVFGTPAIGANGRVYIASSMGNLYALEPTGALAWENDTPSTLFAVGPAIAQATISGVTVDEVIEPDGVGSNPQLWRGTSGTDVTSVSTANRDLFSAPLIFGGSVYFGTAAGGTSHLTKESFGSDGLFVAASNSPDNAGIPYLGVITDGTSLYATTRASTGGVLDQRDTALNEGWTATQTASGYSSEPTIGIDGLLYAPTLASTVLTVNAATGAQATFATLGGVPLTPLQGSDGHLYVPRRTGFLAAYDGPQLSWTFDPPNGVLRQAQMDCSGRLFVASGPTVYAFVTDDKGLADTPWPSLRRDSRNTGNAGAPKYGMRTATGCTQ